jgi:putative ABC transport system permease protein
VADTRHDGARLPLKAQLYVPMSQQPSRNMTLMIRSHNAAALQQALRVIMHDLEPDVPSPTLLRVADRFADAIALPRLFAWILAGFAAAALLVAAAGIYGVVAYSVTMRTREMGVRIALGAGPAELLWLVVRQGVAPLATGIAIGAAGAIAAGSLFRSLLLGVGARDPATLAVSALLLAIVGIAAILVPALRATSTDPVRALSSG